MKTGILAAGAAALAICIVPSLAADSGAPAPGMWDLVRDLYATRKRGRRNATRSRRAGNAGELQRHAWQKRGVDAEGAGGDQRDVKKEVARLGVYAFSLKGDEDARRAEPGARATGAGAGHAGERKDRVAELEVIGIGSKKVLVFEAQSPELKKRFAFQLDNALRYAPHTLSAQSEGVLAAMGDILAQPDAIYSQLAKRRVAASRSEAVGWHDKEARSGGVHEISYRGEPR